MNSFKLSAPYVTEVVCLKIEKDIGKDEANPAYFILNILPRRVYSIRKFILCRKIEYRSYKLIKEVVSIKRNDFGLETALCAVDV